MWNYCCWGFSLNFFCVDVCLINNFWLCRIVDGIGSNIAVLINVRAIILGDDWAIFLCFLLRNVAIVKIAIIIFSLIYFNSWVAGIFVDILCFCAGWSYCFWGILSLILIFGDISFDIIYWFIGNYSSWRRWGNCFWCVATVIRLSRFYYFIDALTAIFLSYGAISRYYGFIELDFFRRFFAVSHRNIIFQKCLLFSLLIDVYADLWWSWWDV